MAKILDYIIFIAGIGCYIFGIWIIFGAYSEGGYLSLYGAVVIAILFAIGTGMLIFIWRDPCRTCKSYIEDKKKKHWSGKKVASGLLLASLVVFSFSVYTFSKMGLSLTEYPTHWYEGAIYPSWEPTQNASTVSTSIVVPSSSPRSNEEYYALLSVFDSAGSYDQIGLYDDHGIWGLAYSWTNGSPANLSYYHGSNNAMTLSSSSSYAFSITAENGTTHFACYNSNNSTVWSKGVHTGGDYLILSWYYYHTWNGVRSGWWDYTVYEEVWQTSVHNGYPNYNFTFNNNQWLSINGTIHSTSWTSMVGMNKTLEDVAVFVNGNSVLIDNFYTGLPAPTIDQPSPPIAYVGNITTYVGNNTITEHPFITTITWHPSSDVPDMYLITDNHSSSDMIQLSWNGGNITYHMVVNWPAGNYNVTCTVYDTLGRSDSSTVKVIFSPTN